MASSADAAQFRPGLEARTRAHLAAAVSHGHAAAAAERTARSLASLVAGEIIPRLVLAHSEPGRTLAPQVPAADTPLDVQAFAPLTVSADAAALLAHVERLLADGVTVDAVMLDLLAPVARLLGRWWEDDRYSFIEVTMGLWRLQELVRELAWRYPPPAAPAARHGCSALFAPFPGEQHDFGAVMVSEVFVRHGWDSMALVGADMSGLLAAVAERHYDVVGLTLSCDCHSGQLRSAIRSLRSVSRNARVRVIVGGRVLNEHPSLAVHAAADGTASDARGALVLAEGLVGARGRGAAGRV